MVGNVEEWVAEWVPRSTACPAAWPFPDYGSDIMCLAGASTTSGPGALLRGGDFLNGAYAGVFDVDGGDQPSGSESDIGFRCARWPRCFSDLNGRFGDDGCASRRVAGTYRLTMESLDVTDSLDTSLR